VEILGGVGFLLILVCWFGMYFRIRREHPQHPLSSYWNYVGVSKAASWQLVRFYRRCYGFDMWLCGFVIGVAMMVILVLVGIGRRAIPSYFAITFMAFRKSGQLRCCAQYLSMR
jgi:hypothetical protein